MERNTKQNHGCKNIYVVNTVRLEEIRMSDLQTEVYHEGSFRRPCKHASTLCNKHYNYRSTLLRHVSTDHTTQKEKPPKPVHTCLICRRTFNRKDLLADHMRGMHSNEFKYKWDTCGSSFRWRGSLNRHRHSRHGKYSYILHAERHEVVKIIILKIWLE